MDSDWHGVLALIFLLFTWALFYHIGNQSGRVAIQVQVENRIVDDPTYVEFVTEKVSAQRKADELREKLKAYVGK
jgi:hypothetical protein